VIKHQLADIFRRHNVTPSEALLTEIEDLVEGIAAATGEAMLDNVAMDAEREMAWADRQFYGHP
jgi:hypothetical protein